MPRRGSEEDEEGGVDLGMGGRDADEVEEEEADPDGEDDDTEEEDEYKPPTKDEWAKTQASLKKANQQAKAWRTKATGKKPAANSKDSDADVEAKAEAIWKPRVVRSAARAALAEAGADSGSIALLVKGIDLDEVDLDEDGEVDGLDDQIEDLKEKYPKLFGRDEERNPIKKRRLRTDPAEKNGSVGKKTATQLQVERLMSGSR